MSVPTFGIGGSRLWDKDTKINENMRKRSSIRPKVNFMRFVHRYFKLFIIILISILILIFLPSDLWNLSH